MVVLSRTLPLATLFIGIAFAPAQTNAEERQLSGQIHVRGKDYEDFVSDEWVDRTFPIDNILTSKNPEVDKSPEKIGWGDECRIELTVKAALLANNRIRISFNAKLFEGDNEATTQLEDEQTGEFTLNKGKPVIHRIELDNDGFDHAWIDFTVINSLVEEDD